MRTIDRHSRRVPIARRKVAQSVNRQREMQRSSAATASNAESAVFCRCKACGGQKHTDQWTETVSTETFSVAVFSTGGGEGVGALTFPHWQLTPHWHVDSLAPQQDRLEEATRLLQQLAVLAAQQQPSESLVGDEQHVIEKTFAARSSQPQAETCRPWAGMASVASQISVRAMEFVVVGIISCKPDGFSAANRRQHDPLDVYRRS